MRSSTGFSGSGTSPATMRRANPSTTAVLPTPASPVRIGLFCRRRVRMSITWRISRSRPMTGSISFFRARSVMFMVNWSSAGVLELLAGAAESPLPIVAAAGSSCSSAARCGSMAPRSAWAFSAFSLASSGLAARRRIPKVRSARAATKRNALRTFVAPCSKEPRIHPSRMASRISKDKSGPPRPLPVLNCSMAAFSSRFTRLASRPYCRSSVTRSVSAASISFSSQCSSSTW